MAQEKKEFFATEKSPDAICIPKNGRASDALQNSVVPRNEVIIVLQFLVGALVTMGGSLFAILAVNSGGTWLVSFIFR